MSPLLRILFFSLVVRPFLLLVLGLNVRHRERLPTQGPAILAANHNSHLDTLALMALYGTGELRVVRPVGAADYWFGSALMRWFSTRVMGIIPLVRGGGIPREQVLAPVLEALDQGSVVIFFPEGTRGDPEVLQPFKSGIAWIASQRPAVPIHPVFLHGLGKALPKGEAVLVPFFCDVFLGEPLRWTGDKDSFMAALTGGIEALAAEGELPAWE